MAVKEEVTLPKQGICVRCKFVSSQEVCKACVLLEGLNKGLPRLGVGKSSKAKKMLAEYNVKQEQEKAALEKAIEDLNDSTNEVISNKISKSKSCRTGKGNNDEIVNNEDKCSNKKCCSGKCKSNQNNDDEKSKTKINSLLEEYGLNDTSNDHKTENGNGDVSVNSDDDDGEVLFNEQEEENSCAGACGKMGSLQIGF